MFEKGKKALDAFSFSPGGMRTVSSFIVVPAVANDRINKIWDEHVRRAREAHGSKPGGWLQCRRQATHECA